MSDNNRGPGKDPDNKPGFDLNKNNKFALFFLISLIIMFFVLFLVNDRGAGTEIPYSTFMNYLESGQITAVKIYDNKTIQGTMQGPTGQNTIFDTDIPYFDDFLMEKLRTNNVIIEGAESSAGAATIFIQIIPWVIGFAFIWFMLRQMQGGGNKAFSFGKSKAKRYNQNDKKVTFDDVAGQAEAKYELQEVVDFLQNPEKFQKLGARVPKGVLLVGMPGTGKTLLAKAAAGEAGVNFFHMSGSDFVEMFVGVGASRVRDLFDQGRKNAPCILFIDELDAVGRTRGAGYGGGHDEREQTLNQMLVEMDGFDTKEGVMILAATNRPDVLDPALLRPGRFDRQVVVDMPDLNERLAILNIHVQKVKIKKNVSLDKIARSTPGTSGADLANLVNEAALFAGRHGRNEVSSQDFEEARDKILLGVARKSRMISPEEKVATAWHEAGHALLYYHLEYADPLHKVTVIPHGQALGLALSLPEKDTYSKRRGWLLDRIKITMGGYVAENIKYGETTTGTKNDIEQATMIARRMITEWGMSEKIGFVSYGAEDEPIFIGKEIAQHKDYSEETAKMIDSEIQAVLSRCLKETERILTDNKDQLEKLAEALVTEETLDDDRIRVLLELGPAVKQYEEDN